LAIFINQRTSLWQTSYIFDFLVPEYFKCFHFQR